MGEEGTRTAAIREDARVVSPAGELLAYELLWAERGATLKSVSEWFAGAPAAPSTVLESRQGLFPDSSRAEVQEFIAAKHGFSISVYGWPQYPDRLLDAKYPPHLIYYRGDINLLGRRCVSIVGSRKCSQDGLDNADRIGEGLARRGVVVVSGLARGADTAALKGALRGCGEVVAVIGTPIDEYYPKENRKLQEEIARRHLLLSQVPFFRYAQEPFQAKKRYFPERNATMAAVSDATIIVEAGETSGTLTQARACIAQGRKLLILESCFRKPGLTWPRQFVARGAIRVADMNDVLRELELSDA